MKSTNFILLCLLSTNCFAGIHEKLVTQDITEENITVVKEVGKSSFSRTTRDYSKVCVVDTKICYCQSGYGQFSIEIPCEFYDAAKKKAAN